MTTMLLFLELFEMHILLSAEKLYIHTITIKTAVLATSIKLRTSEEMRNLSLAAIPIAAGLAAEFRDRLREYVHIAPYCVPDPFTATYDCNYSVILDRKNLNRIVALLANKKGALPQLPWSDIRGERLV